MIPFSLKEFIITKPKRMIDMNIADKLYKYHIIPCIPVREELGVPMTASQKSGYRPQWYEKTKGRSGNSQHTFLDDWKEGSGAVDWTCSDFQENKDKLLSLLIKHTEYTRITVYNTFIHCDYKDTPSGKRELYSSGADSRWSLVKVIM